jgi:beta-ribofuranosylaminobenzene 5'-phosphate synthase
VPSGQFQACGPLAARARDFAARWCGCNGIHELPACRIEIGTCPEPHTGLGTGTQLALTVAAGLNRFLFPHATPATAAELATSVGRGQRSAVGTYGFHYGGLILEPGKLPGETIAPVEKRVSVPQAWRFVLMTPREHQGLSGGVEKEAFSQLPAVPDEATRELAKLAREAIIPAAETDRFDDFAEATYRYGYLAGSCFADVQGAAFAGPRVKGLVETIRAMGIRGVGQSSWGPTVFAVLPDAEAARRLTDRIRSTHPPVEYRVVTTAANNSGALVQLRSRATPSIQPP